MPPSSLHEVLRNLLLNDREIDIYLALLTIGVAPASSLAQRTKMNRSTAQYTCNQLTRKGLLNQAKKKGTFYYTPEPPEKLLHLLERQHRDLERKERDVQMILGDLKGRMHSYAVQPKVEYFEGVDGIEQLYESILRLRAPIDSFEDKGEMCELIPDCVDHFVATRLKHKIVNRVICPSDTPLNRNDPKKFRQVRSVPTRLFPFSCDVKICSDQVSIISFQKKHAAGIVIKHPEIADNFRMLFELLWKLLEAQPLT
ncbi:MAG: helix-turn-helix domain-containing protein [Candidatus Peregrinibacteria bacterium]|nr:helix-turn-helix domain-containing protein [Candidatus Peregrinibacteria bacterium]